eukprot:CAMPEP_0113564108 /NCGR_PEP_ID=MMETSP0015_2-20120614/21433_1 /TAXON_ID=2838 /ORGANISM="Odontella" /LENGTH=757 /DNA_ID=CAMNT_0000466147 /DNA_START=102 /DNA_END=2375 /DNA_ORIENTATION=+ /assembly_acc=CAM_ASM_000160
MHRQREQFPQQRAEGSDENAAGRRRGIDRRASDRLYDEETAERPRHHADMNIDIDVEEQHTNIEQQQRSPHGVDGFPHLGDEDDYEDRASPKKRHQHHGYHRFHHKSPTPSSSARMGAGGDTSATESETDSSVKDDSLSQSPSRPSASPPALVALALDGDTGDQGDDEADDGVSSPLMNRNERSLSSGGSRRRGGSWTAGTAQAQRNNTPSPPSMHHVLSFGSSLPAFESNASLRSTPSRESSLSSSAAARNNPSPPLAMDLMSPVPRHTSSPISSPHSCPERFNDADDYCDDGFYGHGDYNDVHVHPDAEGIHNPDLYVYCDDEGVAHECGYDSSNEDDFRLAAREASYDLERPHPRRRIHWASPAARRHHRHGRRSTLSKQRRGGDGADAHLPEVIKMPLAPILKTPQVQDLSSPAGVTPSGLLRFFLSLSLGTFVLAQSYILAVHRGIPSSASSSSSSAGFRKYFGLLLGGGDVPFSGVNRAFERALKEERNAILREIRVFQDAGGAPAPGVGSLERESGGKFDVILSPRSGRSDLLRTNVEMLRECPSVGRIDIEEGQDSGQRPVSAGAAASGDGPPPRESPGADAVLTLADDVAFTCEELDRAFAVWSANPGRPVGFFPQHHGRSARSSPKYSAASDRALMVHRSVAGSLAHRAALAEATKVEHSAGATAGLATPRGGGWCRHLALSVAASSVASEAPLAIAARPLMLREEEGGADWGYDDASACLTRLASALGLEGGRLRSEERVFLGGSS